MIEKIRNKLEKHVEALLKKPIITNEEFALLSTYLGKLEFEAGEEKREQEMKESNKRLQSVFTALTGGECNGM